MLVSLKNICKEYDNKGITAHALRRVSFDIKVGEFVAVMGPSGSGKSTLLMLLGFMDRPTDGQYFFEKRDMANVSDYRLAYLRNQKIGFVFQPLKVTIHDNIKHSIFHNERRKSCAFIEKKENH